MGTTRNDAFQALFDLTADMTGPGGFITRSRKFKHFSKVPAEQQPAFYQTEHAERSAERTNMPSKRVWKASWVVYVRSDPQDDSDMATVKLNDWLDAFEALLAAPFGRPSQTLGGLVHHCFIEGEIVKVPGDDDGQGMLIVPITILVP